jgi:hypothetical protein
MKRCEQFDAADMVDIAGAGLQPPTARYRPESNWVPHKLVALDLVDAVGDIRLTV